MGAQAGDLTAVYENKSAPDEMKYLAVFKNKLGNSEYLVTYGKDTSFRSYNVGYLFSTYAGAKSVGRDEETTINTIGVVQNSKIKAIITDTKNKVILSGDYLINKTKAAKDMAVEIDQKVEAEFEKYRRMSNPATTADLRKIFRQLAQDTAMDKNESEFPVFDLQIEQSINVKAPSPVLAQARVSMSGTDAISKLILKKSSKWYKNNLDASNALISKIDENVDVSNMTFASFSNKVSYQGLSARLKKALQKHLKVEVLVEEGFDCEDSTYNWTVATWILKDGSNLSYVPGTECD